LVALSELWVVPEMKFDSSVAAQLPEPKRQLAPASRRSSRVFDTSAIFTSSCTCCGALTASKLTSGWRRPPVPAAAVDWPPAASSLSGTGSGRSGRRT
jgi:hypothetical protein